MTFGEAVEQRRKSLKMSQMTLSELIGRSQVDVSGIEKGKNLLVRSPELVAKLEGVLGCNLGDLAKYLPEDHLARKLMPTPSNLPPGAKLVTHVEGYAIPLLGTVGAGKGDDPELYDDGRETRHAERFPPGSFSLKVKGESCQSAGIPDGATVVIEPDRMPEEGEFVVVDTDDGFMLKLFIHGRLHEFRPGQAEPKPIRTSNINVKGIVVHVEFSKPTYHPW